MDDERIRDMQASPFYTEEREASADVPRVYHSFGENSMTSSQRFQASTGRPVALFSHKKVESRISHRQR